MNKAGLYLHVPFCLKKCGYCDFYSLPVLSMAPAYVKAALRQMQSWSEALPLPLESVYFGGGTPTALEIPLLEKLLRGVKDSFSVEETAEWTVEANPGTVDREKLEMLRREGVNRISFGVQSASDRELEALGRIHRFAQARESILNAKAAGFSNLSADLMFGIPEETISSLRESILRVTDLGVTHLSLYGLRIEEGTPFAAAGDSLFLPGEEVEREMYLSSVEWLRELGFVQYEISNFALPGYASKHNLRYWKGESYFGVGPGAHSFLAFRRFSIPPSLSRYLDGGAPPLTSFLETVPSMTEEELLEEEVILSLRLCEGLPETALSRFRDREGAKRLFALWKGMGLAEHTDGRWHFTPSGMLVSNTLLSDLLLCLA